MEGSKEKPIYKCQPEEASKPLNFWMVTVDEGDRNSIMCTGMYQWAAEWLVEQIQGRPFAPKVRS